jgi:hypothetical protein
MARSRGLGDVYKRQAISGGWAYCPRCWTGIVREYGMPKAQTIINNPLTPFAGFVKAIRARSAV